MIHQRARDGDALALSARQLAWTPAPLVREADARQQFVHARAPLGLSDRRQEKGIFDVLARRQDRDQIEALEHEAQTIAAYCRQSSRRHMGHAQLAEPDLARVGPVETTDQVQQRGLAAP